MTNALFELTAIGNAIVDILAPVEEDFLTTHAITRGSMTLIEEARALALYDAFPPSEEHSGGSVANSLAGAVSLGARGAFIGKVAADPLGDIFAHDMRASGAHFGSARHVNGPATARCLIAVTPDGQRSMSTWLGCATLLGPEDIDPAVVTASAIVYLEGYLFDKPDAKRAFLKAAEIARASGRATAITLSDTFCVERHRDDFLALIEAVDIVIANEAECKALFRATCFDEAFQHLRQRAAIVAVTRSEKGAIISEHAAGRRDVHVVTAAPVARVVDSTGAGDLFAGGFLTALARGRNGGEAGQIGAICAAEVISHFGARPEVSLKNRVAAFGIAI